MSGKFTKEYLKELQGYPLSVKVQLTKQRIREWVHKYGEDGVYVSFSGGKDSTVLLHLVREMYGDVIPGVFVDTGLEYPEIRNFVKTFPNIIWLKPEMNFRQVIETYGYPFISKQVSKRVSEYKNAIAKGRPIEKTMAYKEFNGLSTFHNNGYDGPQKSFYNKEKWKFLTEAPFKLSHKCCDVMKKHSFKELEKKGLHPITAQMTSESINRERAWLQHGCNMFDATNPISNPMSFWNEQDVLQYIRQHDLPIASVYGDIVFDEEDHVPGQMSIADYGLSETVDTLKTTGCHRTGCIFCGFGCHLEKEGEGRFERLKVTHPKIYDYIMRPWEDGGLNYKEVIDWINEHGNLHIKY